ncbi:trypsin-like peptidase domain-containing protein [Flavobacteriaceae bacterium TP-CH-4]|uniref:Trypsin-like peptidase domain-containing protein n=1 Tax=Pelagihabitans pacificus TaxID=2696054 RepID=A0A967E524_9FLAO|nr:serine protease [Pelagihabitans pacificus]NHF58110.1 trypsin-like peptidase domain-containing protein [Pelagihabitans pacificus]
MADSLINLLQARTVLIRSGASIGTGTLIAPGRVLTCAHVLRKAVEAGDNIEVSLPDLTQPGHFIWSEVAENVHLSIQYEEQNRTTAALENRPNPPLTTEYPDVAVVAITRKEHAMLAFPEPDEGMGDLKDGQFLAFGFQKKDRELQRNVPQAVSLNYSGEQVDGIIRKLMFTNGLIRPGMSGAALMERESGKIIGIVHMTLSPNDDLGAYVIPLETIWTVFEKWKEEGGNTLFDELRSTAHKARIRKQYNKEYPRFPLLRKHGVKLIFLPLLLFLGLWWVFYHVGSIEDSGLISVLLVAVSISGKLIGDWLGEGGAAESGKLRNSIGNVLISTPFLVGLAAIIAVLWTFSSSVWIHGNSELEELPITFFKDTTLTEGNRKTLDPTGTTRFLLFATPFQKRAALVPEGREPKYIEVQAFSRNEWYYPRDFLLEPVVLIRFDPRFVRIMKRYSVQIEVEGSSNKEDAPSLKYIDSTLAGFGALAIGKRDLGIGKDRELEWKQFLQGQSISGTALENVVTHWKKIKEIPEIDLDIGDRIKVTVIRKKNDSILNEQAYSIRDDLTDKLLKFEFKKPNP